MQQQRLHNQIEQFLQRLNDTNHEGDRKSTRLNSSHSQISYAVFCLKKKNGRPMSFGVPVRRLELLLLVGVDDVAAAVHELREELVVDPRVDEHVAVGGAAGPMVVRL